ncbi:hypothetical protein PUN28_018683 [Cardiocondyla obscurior]|uniref:Uncharacterized protein n=1 Tax=Cardiocondyla obscurior TaxID=286306 RepID=A0AAW2EIX6_9HYME
MRPGSNSLRSSGGVLCGNTYGFFRYSSRSSKMDMSRYTAVLGIYQRGRNFLSATRRYRRSWVTRKEAQVVGSSLHRTHSELRNVRFEWR